MPDEPPEFDHLVLTRYSAVFTRDQPPASEEWLHYRFGFFVEACYASMSRQSTQDFTWLVFCDDRCSDSFREEMQQLADGVFEPVWTHEPFSAVVKRAVVERSRRPYLVTTRLDSDDAVARDFIASVQSQFDLQDMLFVNFPRGLQMDRSGAIHRYDHVSNPFLSLIEKRSGALTVFGVPEHGRARAFGPLREVKAPPMWIQVIHGSNVANSVRGSRVDPRVVAERFDIDLDYRKQVSLPTLVGEKVVRQVRVWALRARHPHLAVEWLRARQDRLLGTRDKPPWRPGASRWRR